MGIKRQIKEYFKKKGRLKSLNTKSIKSLQKYDKNKKTIVFISKAFPTHDKDSGSNRLKEIIFQFKKLGYNCIICVEKIYEDNNYVKFYEDNDCIVYVESFEFKNIYQFIKKIPKIDFFWYNGAETFHQYFEKTKKISSKTVTIYDMVDIHFLRLKRAIEINPLHTKYKKEYAKFYKIETKLSQKADKIIAISEKEKSIMSKFIDDSKIITISNIHYPKIKMSDRSNFEKSKDVIFIGSVHEPNVDAIDFLYNEIMPKVWLSLPEVKVNIIGNVVEKLDTLKYPKFHFLGYVQNIENYFKESRIMVAPLRYGAGVKGKIGQSFEYFLPVVTTEIGAEGMKLSNGRNALIKDDAKDFADAMINLYTDKELWERLSKNSEESLRPFLIDTVTKKIETL